MECPAEPVSAAIPGEHTPGSVGSVSSRSQTNDDETRPRITEPGYGSTPVLLGNERGSLLLSDPLPPLDEAGTPPAPDHVRLQCRERLVRRHDDGRIPAEYTEALLHSIQPMP
jgi:hypothetical protein